MGNEQQKKKKKLQNLNFFLLFLRRENLCCVPIMTGFLSLESSRLGAAGQETEIMGLRLEPEASANSQFVDLANIFLVST